MKNCNFCGTPIENHKTQCPMCKKWERTRVNNSGELKYGVSVSLKDVSAEKVKRVPTGPWDICFGETINDEGEVTDCGITTTSVNLLGGEPGSGKSTLSLQLADAFAETIKDNQFILYMASEESAPALKARAIRTKIKNLDKIRIVSGLTGTVVPSEILETMTRPSLVIIDSTDGWPCDFVIESKKLKEFGVRENCEPCPFILIHHVNKGIAFTGRMDIQHNVDCTIAFVTRDDGSGHREMLTVKNRNGAANVSVRFNMTDTGLEEVVNYDILKFGMLPSKEKFLEVCEDMIEFETPEGETELSAEDFFQLLTLTHSKWRANEIDIDTMQSMLNLAGFDWTS